MLAENVASACLAPLAVTVRRLAVGADVFRPLRDSHRLRFPQGKSIDRPRRPVPARFAVAITHRLRLAAHSEPDRAAKTAAIVRFFFICHDLISSNPYMSWSTVLFQVKFLGHLQPVGRNGPATSSALALLSYERTNFQFDFEQRFLNVHKKRDYYVPKVQEMHLEQFLLKQTQF